MALKVMIFNFYGVSKWKRNGTLAVWLWKSLEMFLKEFLRTLLFVVVAVVVADFILSRPLFLAIAAKVGLFCILHTGTRPLTLQRGEPYHPMKFKLHRII